MLKKTRTIFIILLLFTLCNAGQSAAVAETGFNSDITNIDSISSEEESTAEIRMLNDLTGYVYQCEMMYRDIQWVLDSFDRFHGERSWKNLQLARASLAIARIDLSKRTLPEMEMTLEDQMELMRRGIDVSFLENIDSDFEDEKTSLMNTCVNLHYGIMEGVFLQDDWAICMRYVHLLKDLMACDIQYLANTVDWVLATLDKDEITERFYDLMDSYCPLLRACQAEELESPETIEAKTASLLDHIEELLLDEAKIVGAHSDRLNIMTELIEQEDYETIGENLLEISDMPLAIFYPVWYDDEDLYYYWKENGEIVETPTPGTALERIPDGCKIRITGVTRDEVTDYQTEVERAGLSCLGSSDKDGKLSILYEYENSTFAIIWEYGDVSILMTENPICFVPRWYLPAQQAKQK